MLPAVRAFPGDALSTTRTTAAADATPAGRQRALPLVVLSPGFSSPRSLLTALAEDLAGLPPPIQAESSCRRQPRVNTVGVCADEPPVQRPRWIPRGTSCPPQAVTGRLAGWARPSRRCTSCSHR